MCPGQKGQADVVILNELAYVAERSAAGLDVATKIFVRQLDAFGFACVCVTKESRESEEYSDGWNGVVTWS
jgi:hypothetical protein